MTVLTTERYGSTLLLTLDRPERLNTLTRELLEAIDEQCSSAREDESVRAVVVTGAGTRAFCAGADVNELDGISPADAYELMRFGQGAFDRLAALPQPVIAAVNGVALGGGCELALACDLRVAGASARFGQPEITLANVPGWGGTQRLPRLIGAGRAAEMILTGELIDAVRALAWGLANRVEEDEEVVVAALALAERLAHHSRVALAEAKRAMAHGLEHGQAAGLVVEAEAVARCCETEEQRAAVRAFLTRRTRASAAQEENPR